MYTFQSKPFKQTNKKKAYENFPNYVDETPEENFTAPAVSYLKNLIAMAYTKTVTQKKSPADIEVNEAKRMAICECGQTSNIPLCDGAHTKLLFKINSKLSLQKSSREVLH